MATALILCALLIIAGLAFYAGSLLFELQKQKQSRKQKTQQRIATISQSIQTIALAVEQQQCNLSEGCIRIYHLLEGLPVQNKPDYSQRFPHIYALHNEVKDLPTHQARKDQTKLETRKQDMIRENLEAQYESKILQEMSHLSSFSV